MRRRGARGRDCPDESRTSVVHGVQSRRTQAPHGAPRPAPHHGAGGDGNLFLTLGDHFTDRNEAQNLANHLGKVVRVTPDGAVPPDNPFVGRQDAKPEIWSYGHRNAQGAALHPTTGRLWELEHGPMGGDEINIALGGKNYGWPVIGYGVNYDGTKVHAAASKPRMAQPIQYWVPSIARTGM